jgi:hypothetical protein
MPYNMNTRWERLATDLKWERGFPELRTFVLYVISKMTRRDHQVALLDYYFDEAPDKRDPRFYQFLREGRSAIDVASTVMDWHNPEYDSFKYRNERKVIERILKGVEV